MGSVANAARRAALAETLRGIHEAPSVTGLSGILAGPPDV